MDNLQKRQIIVTEWCYMWKNSGESGSPSASLPYSYRIVEYGFQHVWGSVGYAAKSFGYVLFLARLFWASSK